MNYFPIKIYDKKADSNQLERAVAKSLASQTQNLKVTGSNLGHFHILSP